MQNSEQTLEADDARPIGALPLDPGPTADIVEWVYSKVYKLSQLEKVKQNQAEEIRRLVDIKIQLLSIRSEYEEHIEQIDALLKDIHSKVKWIKSEYK